MSREYCQTTPPAPYLEGWHAGKFRGIIAIDIARREEIFRNDPP
jgi:hypothetical protein